MRIEVSVLFGVFRTVFQRLAIKYTIRKLGNSLLCNCQGPAGMYFNLLADEGGSVRIWSHPVRGINHQNAPMILLAAANVAAESDVCFAVTDEMDLNCELQGQIFSADQQAAKDKRSSRATSHTRPTRRQMTESLAHLIEEYIGAIQRLRKELHHKVQMM